MLTAALLIVPSSSAAVPPTVDTAFPAGAAHAADAAVVIGNEDYAFLPDVPFASRDADSVADALIATRGVASDRVRRLHGANREQILDAVRDATALLGDGGTLWVYFAGHGAASPTTTDALLVGDDAKREASVFAARSVSVPELEGVAGDHPLVLLVDACFGGASRAGEALVPGTRFAVPMAFRKPLAHHVVVTAAGPDQVAGPYPAARHGVFTWLFLGGLRGWADGAVDGRRDGKVTTGELEEYVARGMRELQVANQDPRWEGSRDAVLVEASRLEPAPALADLPWELTERPRPTAPVGGTVTHEGGARFARDGAPFTSLEARSLALKDLEGAAAVHRLKTLPWGQAGVGMILFDAAALGLVMLPLSGSDTFADSAEEQRNYRNFGIGGLVVAAGAAGWEWALGQRTRRQREIVAEAATRVLKDGEAR